MKQELKTDADLEAMLSHFCIKQPENFNCEGQKKISNICINPDCDKVSLHCNDDSCQFCNENVHTLCHLIKFKGISTMLNKRANKQKEFISNLCQIQNGFMSELQRNRCQLSEKYRFGDLEENYLKLIQEIYNKRNNKIMKGNQAKEFCQRLQNFKEKENVENENARRLLDIYTDCFRKFLKAITELKKTIFNHLSGIKQQQKPKSLDIDSSILTKKDKSNVEKQQLYKVIIDTYNANATLIGIPDDYDFLKNILDNPKKVQRVFKASEHQFKAQQFHAKCDGLKNTMTLIETEFGKIVGGYTSFEWTSKGQYKTDPNSKNFIFSLDNREKYIPINHNMLIYGGTGYGPNFGGGGGGDIHIADNGKKSIMNFPYSYNREGVDKIANNQESYKMFSGAIQGKDVGIVEYQVFKVSYE